MKIGKVGKNAIQANKDIKKICNEKGIHKCEVGLSGCWVSTNFTQHTNINVFGIGRVLNYYQILDNGFYPVQYVIKSSNMIKS